MIGEYTPVFTKNITYKAFFLSLLMFSLIFFMALNVTSVTVELPLNTFVQDCNSTGHTKENLRQSIAYGNLNFCAFLFSLLVRTCK